MSGVALASQSNATLADQDGDPRSGVRVYLVRRRDGAGAYDPALDTLVTIFQDPALTIPVTGGQPVTTLEDGSIPGYVASGVSLDAVDAITGARKPLEPVRADVVISDVSRPGSGQNRMLGWNALLSKWKDDAGPLSPRGDRAITVVNQLLDPRATTAANFAGTASGSGTVDQAPTAKVDGYQQQASPKSCQEIKATPDGAAGHYVGLSTQWAANGHPVTINLAAPMVSVRRAGKISGNLGAAWYAALVVKYLNAAGATLQEVVVWTDVPALDTWFVAEGCDGQAPAGTDHVESSLRVYGSTAGNQVTIRCTEFVNAADTDGDIPGYVGGDVEPGGQWIGIVDAASSNAIFDPLMAYPSKDFGSQDTLAFNDATEYASAGQTTALARELGLNVMRLGLGVLTGGAVGPPVIEPTIDAEHIQRAVDSVNAGMRVVLNVPNPDALFCSNGDGSGVTIPDQHLDIYTQAVLNAVAAVEAQTGLPGRTWLAGFEIWNEPNLVQFNKWLQTNTNSASVAKYVGFLNACYTAFKAAYPTVPILGGVMSCGFTGNTANSVIDPVEFYNDMIAQGADFDYLTLHPYPSGPSTGPPAAGWTAINTGLTIGFDRALGQMKDAQRAAADNRLIYVTETGLVAPVPAADIPAGLWQPGERGQAQVMSMILGRLLRDPKVAGVCFFTLLTAYKGLAGDYSIVDTTTMRRRPLAHQIAKMRAQPAQPPSYSEILRIRPTSDGAGTSYAMAPGGIVANNSSATNGVIVGIAGQASIVLGTSGTGVAITRDLAGGSQYLAVNNTLDVGSMVRASGLSTVPAGGAGVESFYSASTGFVQAFDRGASAWVDLNMRGANVYVTPFTGSAIIQSAGTNTASATAIVKAVASQTGDLTQWQNSSGGVLAKITSGGVIVATSGLRVPTGAAAGAIATSDASGNVSWTSQDQLLQWLYTPDLMLWPTDAALKTGTWQAASSTASLTPCTYITNSSNAQNDEIGMDFILAAGTWRLAVYYPKTATSCIVTLNLDGVSQGTYDAYAAATAWNNQTTLDFTVATTGKHRISLKAATRNASSTGWALNLSRIQLRRTA